MIQIPALHCDCCGLPVDSLMMEDCPRCKYPVNPAKEALLLESAINDLQRVAHYGGANTRVVDLIDRYQWRLNYLLGTKMMPAPAMSPAPVAPKAIEVVPAHLSASTTRTQTEAGPSPVTPEQRQVPGRVFSWRSFFADQAINIVASLGAFLLLVGSLSFTATTSNLLLSLLVVFAVHAVFGVTGFITYRFPNFRVVATIYTVIFALLVPLVGFSIYRLLSGNHSDFSIPALVAIAAIYAAIVYTVLAIYQRFIPFAYLGMAALVVADLAFANALKLAYCWWPVMTMLLAMPALISVMRRPGRLFTGAREVLRDPVRFVMYALVTVSVSGTLVTILYSLQLDASATPLREIRFAILSMMLLLLLWTSLFLWLTKRTRNVIVLAYILLASVLAACYVFALAPIGYALTLTGVALLYHGLNRFAGRYLQPSGVLSRGLDQIALGLVFLVPFISSPSLPLQLLINVYGPAVGAASPLHFQTSWQIIAELIAVGVGIVLSISVILSRAGSGRTPAEAAWCWLLLLSGFLLNWEYSIVVLVLNIAPAWSFLGFTLVTVAGAVVVRRLAGTAWANPLDVLALSDIALTLCLSLNQSWDTISILLLAFAILLYAILLYQRRQKWLFLPLIFAVLALPTLWNRPFAMLLIGALLPLAAVAMRQLVSHRWNGAQAEALANLSLAKMWEWPLLAVGLVYGVVVSANDVAFSTSAIQIASGVHVPAALELALLSLAWYASAALARAKLWLVPSVAFAIGAVLMPTNSFWVLLSLAPVIAVLAVGISRFAGRDWALPVYTVALLAAVMTGYTGSTQDHLVASAWALLGFAVLALVIMLVERTPELLVFPAGLAAWAIWLWQPPLDLAALMIVYSVLCVLIFASQFIWRLVPPAVRRLPAARPHEILGIGGQVLVVLVIIGQGGFSADAGRLVHVGAGSLLVLAMLLFWYGRLYVSNVARTFSSIDNEGMHVKRLQRARAVEHWCNYAVGLLIALVVSWELSAFHQTRFDVLLLAPASYLTVIASFLMRDETLPERRGVGQVVSLLGACLLLLPALWFSFSDNNLVPTLILMGESTVLLLLGIATRIRVFVLSSAALFIVGTLRALFLSAPPSLALMALGGTLLAIATGLFLVRHRLRVAWTRWE